MSGFSEMSQNLRQAQRTHTKDDKESEGIDFNDD